MIRYALKCAEDHSFESWFKSTSAFDSLLEASMLSCPMCGSTEVGKAIMTPQLGSGTKKGDDHPKPAAPTEAMTLTAPSSPAEAAMLELKKKIQENSEYVGSEFAREARRIHEGDAPERSIYGETDSDEARRLVEDGVPVAPLPFVPDRKTN